MLESWKHCVATGCTEAAAARTVVMEENGKRSKPALHGSNINEYILSML